MSTRAPSITPASPAPSQSRVTLSRIAAVAAVLALIAGLWHLLGSNPGHAADQRSERTRARPSATAFASDNRPHADTPIRRATSVAEDMGIDVESLPPDEPLAVYLRNSVYPPTSRPLSAANVDLIEWNRRYEREQATRTDPDVTYLFTADKYHVTGADTLTVTLQVWRSGVAAPITITSAYIAPYGAAGEVPSFDGAIPLTLQPAGSLLTDTVALRDYPDLGSAGRPLMLGLFVEFDHETGSQRANFRVSYTPEAKIPARFTGQFEEAMEDGSLVIYAGVEAEVDGHYVIDANLYGADDTPVAWTRFKGHLDAGKSQVRLMFMGRVLVESAASAPYRLGELRGIRYAPGQWPDTEHMVPYNDAYMTGEYDISQFSDAEWDSPHKRATIRRLLEAAESGMGPHVFSATSGQ